MILEIDLNKLIELDITPNDYSMLYLLHKGELDKVKKLINLNYHIIQQLEYKGFLKYISDDLDNVDLIMIVLRKKAQDLFMVDNKEQMWLEFKLAYPIKDGLRPLHANQVVCKERYLRTIKNDIVLHKKILKAIDKEAEVRKQASYNKKQFMPPWKQMPTYINQKGWEMYINMVDDDGIREEEDYGNELI